jgi:hypothetical protein
MEYVSGGYAPVYSDLQHQTPLGEGLLLSCVYHVPVYLAGIQSIWDPVLTW